jgi:antitoxin (DNA-binding transcriptional repressor) of toxin-antitoxin stability system
MKAINVSELEAHLSKYLRMASRGSHILVRDRDEPIAELGPPHVEPSAWRERLAREGRLKPGSQNWGALSIAELDRAIDAQAALNAVREDRNEVR